MKTLWKYMIIPVLLAILTGCARQVEPLDDEQIVVLWHNLVGKEAMALQTLSDNFNAVNEQGIVLITEYQDNILLKLQTASAAHRPDLVIIWPEDIDVYRQSGLIAGHHVWPMAVRQEAADMLPMAASLYTVDGDVLALPLGLATYISYYNLDWVSDLGYDARTATWEDLRLATCSATDPVRGQVGLGIPARASALLSMLTAGGSNITGAEGLYRFDDVAGTRVADVFNHIIGGGCGTVYDTTGEGLAQFSHSALAMIVESSLRRGKIERAVVEGRNFALRIEALVGPVGPGRTLWYGPGLTLVAPEGPRLQAAQAVMTWYFTPEAQTTWSERTEYLPVRRSLIVARADATTSPLELRLLEITLHAAQHDTWVAWPRHTNHVTCRAALLQGLLALDGEASPAGLVTQMAAACNQAVLVPVEAQP